MFPMPWSKDKVTHNFKVGEDVTYTHDGSGIWEPQYGDQGKVVEVEPGSIKVKFDKTFIKLDGTETDTYCCDPGYITNKILDRTVAMFNARRKCWKEDK